ncbi:erythromycin esterase [Marivirga lumbricoides]|uniref:Erythromycin esterase n=2 Tax=Marivirga lumbricoides TaxID=1046115 RepID=A0ABQ1LVV5_9BACT|nr:erythromycin esterase [Marivirga lumbricoides]
MLSEEESEWLTENVISFSSPIDQISPEELEGISLPNGTKVVGLGEANHGTKEFQILKHKLAKYLIHDYAFNTIMLEFPYSHGLLLNDYIQGKNDAGINILTDQKNSEYHNEQMLAFIQDIKLINESRSDSNKIQFLGTDIFGKPYAFERILSYFGQVDDAFEELLHDHQYLTKDRYTYPSKDNNRTFKKISSTILKQLKSNKQSYISQTSLLQYNRIYRLAELLRIEWKGNSRAKEVTKNILLTLNENSSNKIFYFAHSLHVGKNNSHFEGNLLQKALDKSYFAIGTDYAFGSFTLKNMTDLNNIFPDTVQIIPLENCFADHVAEINGNFHYLQFPSAPITSTSWLSEPLYIASTGMGFNRPFTSGEEFRRLDKVSKQFDSIIVFDKISPTKLIKN